MNLCRKCLINLNKHNVVASVLVQIVLYAILLLGFVNQPLDSNQIVITVVIFIASIIILVILLLFLNEKLKQLSICILQIVFRVIICIMIIFLPSLQLENDTTQVKAYFIGKLIASIQIENPNQSYENLKNKTELVCAVIILIGLSLIQSQQINQQDNIIIIILLFSDLITKVLCYICGKISNIETIIQNPIVHETQFKIESVKQEKNEESCMSIKNNLINKEDKTDRVLNDHQQSSKVLGENIFLLEPQSEYNSHRGFQKSKLLIEYQESHSVFLEMLNYFQDGIAVFDLNRDLVFQSPSMFSLMNAKSKQESKLTLLKMKNCQEEIAQLKNKEKFYDAALKKASKQELHCESFGERGSQEAINLSRLLDCNTVGDALKLIVTKFQKMNSEAVILQIHNFTFDMLCTLGSVSMSLSIDQRRKESEKLFKVQIKPFLFKEELYTLVQVKDVTHQNEILYLQQLNENKSQMMEQVTHEFRTPLNCIILLVQDLIENSEKSVVKNYLEPVLISAQALLSLIQDLLDLAQLRAGKFQLYYQEFDIFKLVEDLKILLTPNLSLRGNFIQIIKEKGIPPTIFSDQNRIRQVLINLIGNAAKFTQNGTITIGLKNMNRNQILIYVKDTGIGINPEDQNKLFKAFAKLDHGKDMNVQGVGLGLMISNVLAEKLSMPQSYSREEQYEPVGLSVNSDGQGHGSTFSFIVHSGKQRSLQSNPSDHHSEIITIQSQFLWMVQSHKISEMFLDKKIEGIHSLYNLPEMLTKKRIQQELSCYSSNGTNRSIRKKFSNVRTQTNMMRISPDSSINRSNSSSDSIQSICGCKEVLVVDDEPFNILAIKTLLKRYNINLDETTNPVEAVQKIKDYHCPHHNLTNYKLIFLDLEMPIQDGFETAKQILQISKDAYLIACSGHSGDLKIKQCKEAGFKELLTKPINRVRLDELIKTMQQFYDSD